jgi:hypothetical protein
MASHLKKENQKDSGTPQKTASHLKKLSNTDALKADINALEAGNKILNGLLEGQRNKAGKDAERIKKLTLELHRAFTIMKEFQDSIRVSSGPSSRFLSRHEVEWKVNTIYTATDIPEEDSL